MTAPQLLENMREHGFAVSVKEGRLSVVPASQLTDSMRDALKAHKAELLALLAQATSPQRVQQRVRESWRKESPDYWQRVGKNVSEGAVSICAMLQAFPFIFDMLHAHKIPKQDCWVTIDNKRLLFENVPDILRAIELDWTDRARSCNLTRRALSEK